MKKYLVLKFGSDEGNTLSDEIDRRVDEILSRAQDKSENQLKTMRAQIVPRIAMYQILQQKVSKDEAYALVKDFVHNYHCPKIKKRFLRLQRIPFFARIFQTEFVALMKRSDNWVSECVRNDKTGCQVNIKKCLWYDTCKENGCPELTEIFCDSDDINYGELHKIKFSRSSTLGKGAQMCDFHYDR